jgi:hypothetical protein
VRPWAAPLVLIGPRSTAALIGVLNLLGVPVADWLRSLFKKVAEVPAWAIAAGVLLETLQTSLAALAWLAILRAAFPRVEVPFRLVLASYATAVALNDFLPANLGTWVMLVMLATLIAGATFATVFSGLVVEKIPFSILNVALYLYLFLSVSGSFSIKLGFASDHSALLALILGGGIALLVLLARIFWRRLAKLRAQLAAGPRWSASGCRPWGASWHGSGSSPSSWAPMGSR